MALEGVVSWVVGTSEFNVIKRRREKSIKISRIAETLFQEGRRCNKNKEFEEDLLTFSMDFFVIRKFRKFNTNCLPFLDILSISC